MTAAITPRHQLLQKKAVTAEMISQVVASFFSCS